tara:strand:- start:588 stop:1310 length:723 start_codon:yes stop_codon:yes gene_type:complete
MSLTKSSHINLYASDDLAQLTFRAEAKTGSTEFKSAAGFTFDSAKLSLVGNADSAKDIDDVAEYLHVREADRAAKFLVQDNKNVANDTALFDETTARTTTFTQQAALITAEVSRAAGKEAQLQSQIDTELQARISNYNTLDARIAAEILARQTAFTNATNATASALSTASTNVATEDSALNARLDAILAGSGVDYDTLKEIVDAYELQDSTISSTVTVLRSDFDALKLKFETAFPDSQPL